MLTAAKTPSNESTSEAVQSWQQTQRSVFKQVFEEITLPKHNLGSIVVVCVTGQRYKGGPVLRPDSSLAYLHGRDLWSVGIEDNLLGPEIVSHVWMQVSTEPVSVHKDADVHESNRQTCELASHGNIVFPYEGRLAHTRRLLASGIIPKANRPAPLRLG
jgi:hypothetical protein